MMKKNLKHALAVALITAFVFLALGSAGSSPSSYSGGSSYDSSSSSPGGSSEWNLNMFGENSIGGVWRGSIGDSSMILGGSIVQVKVNGVTSTGTATISGNYLNLYFTSGPLAGDQFRYTIVTDKLIQGDGENFSRY
jgi:hypothetical protein